MMLKDIVELIKCDIPDLTEGPFRVNIESDDGGSHITIFIEFHNDCQKVRNFVDRNYKKRIIIKKVPEGFLKNTS
tara:strand:+ start:684 stop:908 length:225 start_codon:yes stop_codon:yes gene_type:complete